MTSFRDAIRSLHSGPVAPPRLRETPNILIAAQRMSAPVEGSDAPRKGKNYNTVARELLSKIRGRIPLAARELRDGAWCLWTTDPALANSSDALHAIVAGVEECEKKHPFRALASSYVASFDVTMSGIDVVSKSLARQARSRGRPWADLQASFQILNKSEGPDNIARAAIGGRVSPSEILKHGGLGTLDAQSGFAKACAGAVLERLASEAGSDPQERLELVRRLSLSSDGRLVFSDHAPLVANALLKPFGSAMPEKSLRDKFLELLIALFGDPRLKPGGWTRMRDAEAMVRRWLTEQSLRQFLDVVDRVADERMWKYRRAFWEAVYKEDLVSEAWVVFDRHGVAEARRAFGREASFGEFVGRGAKQIQQGHSVLLLRVGRGVVADWSHNGKCNIWNDAESVGAPKLYRRAYSSDDVRLSEHSGDQMDRSTFSVAHMGADNYNWQRKVAAKIHQMTGFRVSQSSYVVR